MNVRRGTGMFFLLAFVTALLAGAFAEIQAKAKEPESEEIFGAGELLGQFDYEEVDKA